VTPRKPEFDDHIAAFNETHFAQATAKRSDESFARVAAVKKSNQWRWLLPVRRERPRRRSAECCDERTPVSSTDGHRMPSRDEAS
jgi:hypothetical protein